jgi:Ca2+/Na+ antiporter
LNLALGSALATIGLTIPAVAAVSIVLRQPLELGLNAKDQLLLAFTLLVGVITLGTGRTTVLQGIVHLVIFTVFLFFAVVDSIAEQDAQDAHFFNIRPAAHQDLRWSACRVRRRSHPGTRSQPGAPP